MFSTPAVGKGGRCLNVTYLSVPLVHDSRDLDLLSPHVCVSCLRSHPQKNTRIKKSYGSRGLQRMVRLVISLPSPSTEMQKPATTRTENKYDVNDIFIQDTYCMATVHTVI